jgi:chromosome segregation ATPase
VDTPAVPALLIGTLFVEKGLITQEQLDLALEEQRATGERLGEILVERFGVSRLDLASALAEQWAEYERQGGTEELNSPPRTDERDLVAVSGEWQDADATPVEKRPIGEIFLERGMIDEQNLTQALDEQRATGKRLGEILVGQGNLTRLELASALADQWASFQKLRPPADNGIRPPAETGPVMPTPEISAPAAAAPVPPAELAGLRERIDALGLKLEHLESALAERPIENTASADVLREELAEVVARVDDLAITRPFEDDQASVELPAELAARFSDLAAAVEEQTSRLQELAVLAESRVDPEQLERRLEELAARPSNGVVEVPSALAALEETVALLESGREAWRHELDSIADGLRGRLDSLEEAASRPSEDPEAVSLRSDLDALAVRLDSLPEPPSIDALQGEVNRLATRVDEVAGQLPSGIGEIGDTLSALASRIDELPTPSDEWREQVDALRTRFDELASPAPALDELRAGLTDLSARIDAIPSTSDEWRSGLEALAARVEAMQADVNVRLERTEQESVKRLGRGDVKQINRRIEDLANELPETRRQIEASLASLSARIAAIPPPSDERREQFDALAEKHGEVANRLPEELQDVRERMDALTARIDQIPSPSEEWRGQIDALRVRFEEVTGAYVPAVDGVRGELAELRERVDAIPPANDEWRHELAHVAENLRARLEHVEAEATEHARSNELAHFQTSLDALSNRLDAVPTTSEEWRGQIEALRGRLDEIAGAQPTGLEELRVEIATLGARLDAVPTDEWRGELGEVAENLRVRLDQVEADASGRATSDQLAEVRERVDEVANKLPGERHQFETAIGALNARIDAIPTPTDEWREGLAALEARVESVPDDVRVRLDRIEDDVAGRADHGSLAEIVSRLDELDARIPDRLGELRSSLRQLSDRVDAVPAPSEEWRSELAHIAENLRVRIERVESGLELRPGLDLVAGLREELQTLTARLEERLEEAERRTLGSNEHPDRVAQLERRLEEHAHRLEELHATMPSVAGVAESINARVDASEAAAVDLGATLDERLVELEQRLGATAGRVDFDVESIRRELDDLRGVTAAAAGEAEVKIDQLAEALRGEIAGVASAAYPADAIERLGTLAADHGDSLDALQAELHQYEQRLEERLAGKAAELAAMRTRFEQVEGSLAGVEDSARTAGSELDARFAAADEKLAALEKSQVKRGDVRELRESVARVEQKVDADSATEDARVRAVEEAVRDGLASLGSQLADTQTTYVEAGTALRRSIERLGSAIRSADEELEPPPADEPRQIDLSSFLAFAPTPEGYRLVELEGAPPAIGETVEVPDFPPQVVTRLGVSPLPFDRRVCAYLEPL